MSFPLAAKVGAGLTLAAGAPISYVVWEKFFYLNEIDKIILEEESTTWEVTAEDSESKVVAKVIASLTKTEESAVSYKWECEITTTMPLEKTKDDLKNYLTSKLISSENKNDYRKYLVKACSKDSLSDEYSESKTRKTKLIMPTELREGKLFTYLLDLEN